MARGKAVHFKHGNGTWCNYYAPASENWKKSDNPKEVTCQTCKDVHRRHFGDAVSQVHRIARCQAMDKKEILEWYAKAKVKTDLQRIRLYASAISDICAVVDNKLLSDEEFEAELDNAIVANLMEG